MGSKIDVFLDGLWKALWKELERVLGFLGGLLGKSMFQIHYKSRIKRRFFKMHLFVGVAPSDYFCRPTWLVWAHFEHQEGGRNSLKWCPKLGPIFNFIFWWVWDWFWDAFWDPKGNQNKFKHGSNFGLYFGRPPSTGNRSREAGFAPGAGSGQVQVWMLYTNNK